VLREHLDEFVMVYLDNIIIYLNTEEEYKEYIKWVLKRLYDENIPIAVEKCEFYIKKTDFVGFIVKPRQISINLKKVKAIVNWQDLKNVTGLRSFLGFCNYYKRFINKWLDKIKLFIRMMKKNKPWKWDDNKARLFKEVKQEFTKKPILKIYQLKLPMKVKIDASDFILRACLLQKHEGI